MTVITDPNIRDLVEQYINGSDDFPENLVDIPIGDWDVSRVTNMEELFRDADFNEPIGNWNVSNVTNMKNMFEVCDDFNQSIGNWNVSRVTDMSGMFLGCRSFNQPIGAWNVSNVTDMNSMFIGCLSFNQPIGTWNVFNVTYMSSMFEDARSFNQPIGEWNVSNVTDMSSMFLRCLSFNQPIGKWNVSNVTDMNSMFRGARSFNQPIGDWDVSRVIRMRNNMYNMFSGAESFSQPVTRWNLRPVIMVVMFETVDEFNNYTARAARAPAVPAPAAVPAVPAVLQTNSNYKPALLPTPHFSVSKEKVFRDSEYFDLIEVEDKHVLDALDEDPTAFVFSANKQFYVISASDLTNLMNDPNVIKYECLRVEAMGRMEAMRSTVRSVPYFSINSIGIQSQGAVPYFHLWTAVHSGNRTYELVKTARRLPSTASHNYIYNIETAVSSAHCQAGQDVDVYELRILPVDREHSRRSAATKIQKVIRGHISRKKPNSGGKKRSNRRKHARHNKRTRKGSRMHKKMH